MTDSDDERAQQRAKWRQALAAKAKADRKRQQRYTPRGIATATGVGKIRIPPPRPVDDNDERDPRMDGDPDRT